MFKLFIGVFCLALFVTQTSCSSNSQKTNTLSKDSFIVGLSELDSSHHRVPFTNAQLFRVFSMLDIEFDTTNYYVDDFIKLHNDKRLFIFRPMKKDSLLCVILDDKGLFDYKRFYYPKASKGHDLDSQLWSIGDSLYSIVSIPSDNDEGPILGIEDPRIVRIIKFTVNKEGKLFVVNNELF